MLVALVLDGVLDGAQVLLAQVRVLVQVVRRGFGSLVWPWWAWPVAALGVACATAVVVLVPLAASRVVVLVVVLAVQTEMAVVAV